jgi:hypothetical protein
MNRFRLLVALVALIGLTAFAPAPFVKPDRKRDRDEGDILGKLQGTWSISSKVRMGPNGILSKYSTSQKLQIEKDAWQLTSAGMGKGGKGGGVAVKMPARPLYKIEIEPSGYPREFKVKRNLAKGSDYMVGIVSVEGDTARMLYRLAVANPDDTVKPTAFEPVPEGWYLMTLKRDSK